MFKSQKNNTVEESSLATSIIQMMELSGIKPKNKGWDAEEKYTVNLDSIIKNFSEDSEGGLVKIDDEKMPCLHRLHESPTMILLSPGTYEYTCPSCGQVTKFSVPLVVS